MSSQLTADPPAELAPSETRSTAPVAARVAGAFGLMAVTAGVVSVIAAEYGRAVLFGGGLGYLLAALGLAGLFLHAVRDADPEVRRAYGAFAALLLLAAAVVSVVPGAPSGGAAKSFGYYLLPWGVGGWVLALLFAVPFARHEDDPAYRRLAVAALLGGGVLLGAGSVVAGVLRPDTLVGPGTVLALVGLGYLAAYLAAVDTSDGPGYWAAVGLGAVGAAALFVAFAQAVFPTVLHDGPAALRNARQGYDKWAAGGRLVVVLAALAGAYLGATRLGRGGGTAGVALRTAAGLAGVATAAVFALGTFSAPWTGAVPPYLVPSGLLLGGVGLAFLLVAVGVLSDAPLVVLTRRELASYFYSPIAYLVLFAMAFFGAIGYSHFTDELLISPADEPIVQRYPSAGILAAFQVVFLVPVLTMRLFSEEQRSGTLEVLLTAPVNEVAVVLSKFLAAWVFYMLCWVPMGLYLVALRSAGGQPFDYRPLLSFYLALGACGAAFVGLGLFFSSLTRNQIVAAVLTFAAMTFQLLTVWLRSKADLGGLQAVLGRLDFLSLWHLALGGQLLVTDVLVQLSLAVFWLFLTVKVLEIRKWG